MRMTYAEYKMHNNVLLNNSQPIIGPNVRRCVSLMDLCFLCERIEKGVRAISFAMMTNPIIDRREKGGREGLLRGMRQLAMTNASLAQTIPDVALIIACVVRHKNCQTIKFTRPTGRTGARARFTFGA